MWLRVASLWGCTVEEAQQRCSAREFLEWCQFYRDEPWGVLPADLMMARQTAALVNLHSKNPVSMLDYTLYHEKPKRKASGEHIRAVWSSFCQLVSRKKANG